MNNYETGAASAEAKPSRRTIIKGAAWSVPVIAAAAALPQAAASDGVTQTQCADDTTLAFAITSSPVTPAYNTVPSHRDPNYPIYEFKDGLAYEITVTSTVTYTGTLPAEIADLSFPVMGTPWFNWSFTGTPTVSSSRGNVAFGSSAAVPGAPAGSGLTSITPVSVGTDVYVHPNDVLTITWNLIANGPANPIGPTGSGFAYPLFGVTSCGDSSRNFPPSADSDSDSDYPLYQYVL